MARARGPTVGDPAPPLRLPCAQGGEIDLQSYRGRALVIVWFTKGFSCPFCRQQMSQLARVAPKYRAVGAEVLVVSRTPAALGRRYAERFTLPLPYLCDEAGEVRRAWGLEVRRRPLGFYATKVVRRLWRPAPIPADFGTHGVFGAPAGFRPTPRDIERILADEDTGFFVIDRRGVVCFADRGSFRADGGRGALHPIPPSEVVLAVLERCAS